MRDSLSSITQLLPALRQNAGSFDQSGEWPADDLALLAEAGVMRWAVPRSAGGLAWSPLKLFLGYERIATASLALALVLSQRDAAIGHLQAALPSPPAANLLERLARNEIFSTVGIAQLTTSRQGGPPALRATRADGGWQLEGLVPWATGAARSDHVVVGAITDDGQQLLLTLPMRAPGVRAPAPLPLVSLRSTWTGQILCNAVYVEQSSVLRGPSDSVLGGRKNNLPLGQAFLATGLTRAGLDLIAEHQSAPAKSAHARLEAQLDRLREQVLFLSSPGHDAECSATGPQVRGKCAELALRVMHTAVALYKGTALMLDHPAQRLAREAMFLLVWSCPSPVIECTVDLLSGQR